MKTIGKLTAIAGFIELMASFTNWVKNYTELIFEIYLALLLIIYVIGIIVNSYLTLKQLSELKIKYAAMIDQFNSDKAEKEDLLKTIDDLNQRNTALNLILATRLSPDQLEDLRKRENFLKDNEHYD